MPPLSISTSDATIKSDLASLQDQVDQLQGGTTYISPTTSTDGVTESGGPESSGTITTRTNAIQSLIEDAINDGPPAILRSALYQIDSDTLILPHRGTLSGRGGFQTILKCPSGSTGFMISTEDYDSHLANADQWRFEGIPAGMRIENLGFHGSGGAIGFQGDEGIFTLDDDPELNAIQVFGAGMIIDRCVGYDIKGTFILLDRGTSSFTEDQADYFDHEVNEISNVYARNVISGVHWRSGADGSIHDVYIAGGRDYGVYLEAGALFAHSIHVWNFETVDPTNWLVGCAIVNGKPNGTSGENHLGTSILADNSRCGLWWNSTGGNCEQYVAKLCDYSLVVSRTGYFDFIRVVLMNAGGTGIFVETYTAGNSGGTLTGATNATGQNSEFGYARIDGINVNVAGDYTTNRGVVIHANFVTFNKLFYNGGGVASTACVVGRTAAESPDSPQTAISTYGVRVNLLATGCGKGFHIKGLAAANQLICFHSGNVTSPVTVESGIDCAANGNLVLDVNLVTGVVTKYGTTGAYTLTNVTTDRTVDANSTSIDELADLMGTAINDLKAQGILR